jgi:glycine dehydrogenase subunit 1
MPFIPHTDGDVAEMLAAIGAPSVDALFDEIPASLRGASLQGVPDGLTEMEVGQLMSARARLDGSPLNFIGAGAYEHHIPAAVWAIVTRGEFYSAYTPYQAEASQGTLQLLYEYQTMMASLTGMQVSNASLYDGASALAEACLMAVRANRKTRSTRVLVPGTLHPTYLQVARTITAGQSLSLDVVPYRHDQGTIDFDALQAQRGSEFTAVVIQQPNFFGLLEDVHAITDWAHEQGALVIAVVNPLSLAILSPPGQWGAKGVDIVVGDGQPLGVPLSSGGPYFGFMTTRMEHVRQMPGRIIGRTLDLDGKPGFTLTLQAREQHIRRSKATSNICTNQGLLVTAATIHLSLLGATGLANVAAACQCRTSELLAALTRIDGVRPAFGGPRFHEAVVRLDRTASEVLEQLAQRGIAGGYDLSKHFPELGQALLVCATEVRTGAEIERYANALKQVMG